MQQLTHMLADLCMVVVGQATNNKDSHGKGNPNTIN